MTINAATRRIRRDDRCAGLNFNFSLLHGTAVSGALTSVVEEDRTSSILRRQHEIYFVQGAMLQ